MQQSDRIFSLCPGGFAARGGRLALLLGAGLALAACGSSLPVAGTAGGGGGTGSSSSGGPSGNLGPATATAST